MFSNEDIIAAIKRGELIIEPFSPKHIRAAGVTLHLSEDLLRPVPGTIIDPKRRILPEYEEIKITAEKPYMLKPGEFILGATLQSVTVGHSLGFLIEGRSTMARLGLTIVQTAMMVEPGHSGRPITLELANNGANPILLYPKLKIARAAIFELKSASTDPYDQDGKYKDQGSVGRPIFKNEFWED